MDIRSFEQNYEVNALEYDAKTAKLLRQEFFNEVKRSIVLDYETFINRPYLDKLKEGFAKVFSPLL